MRRTTAFVLAVSTGLALSARLFAQTDDEKNTARDFGKQGQEALDRGDAKTAEDRYHRAVMIFDSAKASVPPTLLLGYARGAAKNNHFIAADEAYNRIVRAGLPPGAPAAFVAALEDAKKEIETVVPHIARVTINITGCDSPAVTLDGVNVPSVALGVQKPVDPGTHEVKASAAGCKSSTASFTVSDGKEATTSIALEKEAAVVATNPNPNPNPLPNANPNPIPVKPVEDTSGGSGLRVAGIVTLGLGGAGLILGAITGGVAIGQHGDIQKACGGGTCPASEKDAVSSYQTMGTLSTIGFVAGGVLAAAGVIMILVAPSSKKTEKTAWITPVVGLGTVGFTGRF